MACVMCQIAPIKADLYFLFCSLGERRKKESESQKKKKKKENAKTRRRKEIDGKPFRKLDQPNAFLLNLLINIFLINYDLHLLEMWEFSSG